MHAWLRDFIQGSDGLYSLIASGAPFVALALVALVLWWFWGS